MSEVAVKVLTIRGREEEVRELSYDGVLELPVDTELFYVGSDNKVCDALVMKPQPCHETHGGVVGKLRLIRKGETSGYANIWKGNEHTGVFVSK